MNTTVSIHSPLPAELKRFIGDLSTRNKRISYLHKQINRYSLWLTNGHRIIALLGGIRIKRSMEVWYWEVTHKNNDLRKTLLEQALEHLIQSMAPNSVLWYPKLPRSETRILRNLKFGPVKELNMTLSLKNFKEKPSPLPSEYKIKSWQDRHTGKAAELNFSGNKGTINSLVTISLQTRAGAREALRRTIKDKNFIGGHTLWHKNRLAGYHLVGKEKKLLLLNSLVVHPAHRGKGLGKTLFIHTINQLGVKPFSEAGLGVYDQNRTALNIYRNAGFKTRDSNTYYLRDLKNTIGISHIWRA